MADDALIEFSEGGHKSFYRAAVLKGEIEKAVAAGISDDARIGINFPEMSATLITKDTAEYDREYNPLEKT